MLRPIIILIIIPMFMGYASLFALQRELKKIYGISDDPNHDNYLFGYMVASLYLNNLVFRLGHWFAKSLKPYTKAMLSMISMAISMIVLICVTITKSDDKWLWWVAVAYCLGGVGIGTFEANQLYLITPLGEKNQRFSSLGIPIGVTIITVGGFIALTIGVHVSYIYMSTLLMLVVGMIVLYNVFGKYVEDVSYLEVVVSPRQTNSHLLLNDILEEDDNDEIKNNSCKSRSIIYYYVTLFIDMAFVSFFCPGAMLYLIDQSNIDILSVGTISNHMFFAIYNIFTLIGAITGRLIAYKVRLINPLIGLCTLILGGLNNILLAPSYPVLSYIGAFLVLGTNGFIYNQSWRFIHRHVKNNNKGKLWTLSVWLLCGDIGSVISSCLISYSKHALES